MLSSGWRTDVRDGYRTKTVKSGNFTVNIHRPILPDSERLKMEEQARQAIKYISQAEK